MNMKFFIISLARIELHSFAVLSPASDLPGSPAHSPFVLCKAPGEQCGWRFAGSSSTAAATAAAAARSRMATEIAPSAPRCGMVDSKRHSGTFSTRSLANFLLLLAPKGLWVPLLLSQGDSCQSGRDSCEPERQGEKSIPFTTPSDLSVLATNKAHKLFTVYFTTKAISQPQMLLSYQLTKD